MPKTEIYANAVWNRDVRWDCKFCGTIIYGIEREVPKRIIPEDRRNNIS